MQQITKKLVLVFVLFLGTIESLFGAYNVEEGLKHVSWRDKIYMRKFFDYAIKLDGAAHVLCFDHKAVCFTGVIVKYKHRIKALPYYKEWLAFKKNEHLFPHPNFIFCEELNKQDEIEILDIYIINKAALYECLLTHDNLFKNAFGEDFSPDWFIGKLEEGQTLTALINHSDFLLGILLGYGEESAKAYQDVRRADGLIPEWTETYTGIDAPQPRGCKILPVSFMGNPKSPKTQQLLFIYEDELQTIWNDHQKKNDSLIFFLEHLCREKS